MDELSIVCAEENVPDNINSEKGWRMLRVAGQLDFQLTGILAQLTTVLADNNIPVFAISTYNTDYLLLRNEHFGRALEIFSRAGYQID